MIAFVFPPAEEEKLSAEELDEIANRVAFSETFERLLTRLGPDVFVAIGNGLLRHDLINAICEEADVSPAELREWARFYFDL
ncbi:MAG: hypothetical protein A3G45_02090 [Candidatus Staskawiczbacteria bacterium RIFCSPLOWO2_12_FULL_37_15]|uniref:Uncharacterized protein n=1 Tax=Candidatus Staskawiczbacteria bacterium RIFCSPLOWO2_12_FULL_37_15 TaxID=1802218 RepID=A0A1G2IKH2_9BACT|nr:MAG: hypothetical protein A3G45_02090 [Candidatus Staskawiczbacteria bacterium RIFCSPLOWO2_12_FULL_37_15]